MTVSDRPLETTPSVEGHTTGLAVQFLLLGMLAAGVGLNAAGWVVGSVYAFGTWLLLGRALRRSGTTFLGPANQVTLARATLVGGVAALAADWLTGHAVPVAVFVTLAAVALALDAVDGQVARRTGSTSALGARFDMEVDAILILVLSAVVAQTLGLWVLAIGVFRYAFVVASWALPWLRAALPHRMSRKTVAAIQGIALAVASSGLLPFALTLAVVGTALALLVWSFSRDVAWLWHAHQIRRSVAAG
ncbi:CDP-alcohol phosphatidyltransferase family protein [Phytohabitans kaempferiae]|uniref:CDP-alcohol phosphatidyltransferase family protein n=1 Tax=Phytohabitans kaempferiae TaxID=1620943 RepID=A0ABV6MGC6_9ACTN